jgi:hypothetical protein
MSRGYEVNAGEFERLPVRNFSLWARGRVLSGGAVEHLKPYLRLQLAEQGFVVDYRNRAFFAP